MACIECKQEKDVHSLDIPLCEDCYEDMFEIKSDVADVKLINEVKNITLITKNDVRTNTLVFTENGDVTLNGRLLANDKDIVNGMKLFLTSAGAL
jgi:hypothetical protein